MSHENVEVMRRANALFNAGDIDGALDLHHPDVEFRFLQHPPDVPEVVRGRAAARVGMAQWFDAFDEVESEVYEYHDAHPWVIADVRWRGRGKGSGMRIDLRAANAHEIMDDVIVRTVMGYPDVAAAREGVGLAE